MIANPFVAGGEKRVREEQHLGRWKPRQEQQWQVDEERNVSSLIIDHEDDGRGRTASRDEATELGGGRIPFHIMFQLICG